MHFSGVYVAFFGNVWCVFFKKEVPDTVFLMLLCVNNCPNHAPCCAGNNFAEWKVSLEEVKFFQVFSCRKLNSPRETLKEFACHLPFFLHFVHFFALFCTFLFFLFFSGMHTLRGLVAYSPVPVLGPQPVCLWGAEQESAGDCPIQHAGPSTPCRRAVDFGGVSGAQREARGGCAFLRWVFPAEPHSAPRVLVLFFFAVPKTNCN